MEVTKWLKPSDSGPRIGGRRECTGRNVCERRAILVWGFRSQVLMPQQSPLSSSMFLCSTWRRVSSSRRTYAERRRAQGRSRPAVALALPCALSFPGRVLIDPSTAARWRSSGPAAECMNRAELAEGRQPTHRNLVFGGSSRDPNHDAVIRIRAKLRAAVHSRNRRSMPWFATGVRHLGS